MTTGTVQSASVTLSKHRETKLVTLTLTNGEGAELFHGQEVSLTGNLEVSKRDVAAQKSIGVVSIGGLDGEEVSIATAFQRTLKVIAKGGTLTAGDQVLPDGTRDANGLPGYAVSAPTALTAEDAAVVDATYGTEESGVINNIRTRLGELEARIVAPDEVSGIVLVGNTVGLEALIGIFRTPQENI